VPPGAIRLLLEIPVLFVGCGCLDPGAGYFWISNTTSRFGILFINIFMAFGGGLPSAAVIAYRKHRPVEAFLGSTAGYVACTALIDIAAPWQRFVPGLLGPLVMRLGGIVTPWLKVDDQKIVPPAR